MEGELVGLLKNIFSGNNESVQSSENQINGMSLHPEFFPVLLSIARNNGDYNIKKEAIIVFGRRLLICWSEMEDNVKYSSIGLFIEFLDYMPRDLLRLCSMVADNFVSKFFFKGGWPQLPELVYEKIHLLSGIILAKSICKKLKNGQEAQNEFFYSFCERILPILAQVIVQSNDFVINEMILHCLSRILSRKFTEENPIPEFLHSNLCIFIEKSLLCDKLEKTSEFCQFGVQSCKLLSRYLTTYKNDTDNQYLQSIFSLIQMILGSPFNSKFSCKALEVLYTILFVCGYLEVFEENADYFLNTLFPPFYRLQNEELQLMVLDPSLFVSSIHKSCENWSDPRSSVSRIISKASKKSSAVMNSCYERALYSIMEYNHNHDSSTLFSSLLMFSAAIVRNNNHDQFAMFLDSIEPLIESDDIVARASGFMVISEAVGSELSIKYIVQCVSNLEHEDSIIKYYSAAALSTILQDVNGPNSEEIKFSLKPYIEQLFSIFSNLANEFQNENFTTSLAVLVQFFKDDIIPFAGPLALQMLNVFVENSKAQNEIENSNAQVIVETCVFSLIEVLSKSHEASSTYIVPIFSHIIEAIQALNGTELVDKAFDLASKIISESPIFYQVFWDILELLFASIEESSFTTLDDVSLIIQNLIDKDPEISNNKEVINLILSKMVCILNKNDDEWPSAADVLTVLGIKTNGFGEYLSPIIDCVISVLESSDRGYELDTALSSLFGSMIYVYGDSILTSFSVCLDEIVEIWLESASFPVFPAALLPHFEELTKLDILPRLISALIHCMSITMKADDEMPKNEEEEDMFDDFEVGASDFVGRSLELPKIVDQVKLVNDIYQFIIGIQKKHSVLFNEAIETLSEAEIESIEMIPQFSKKLEMEKKNK